MSLSLPLFDSAATGRHTQIVTSAPGRSRLWPVLLFTTTFVLIVNLAFWGMYRQTEHLLEAELSQRLSTVALLASQKLVLTADNLTSAGNRAWCHDRLEEVTVADSLTDLFLVDDHYRLLATTTGETDSLYPFAVLYQGLIDSLFFASHQMVAITPLRKVGAVWLRTAFAPVFDVVGVPVAVIGVDATIDYFDDLARLRRRLSLASLLSVVIGGTLGGLFYALQRRFQKSEAELGRTRSQAQLGQMVAVVSHEIKNPLMIMRGAAERLRRKTELPEAQYLIGEVDRLNEIVSGYLNFARSGGTLLAAAQVTTFDLIPLLAAVRHQSENRGEDLAVSWTVWPTVTSLTMTGYPAPLRQVLLNLVGNAIEACHSAGKPAELSLELKVGRSVTVLLTDNGPGISETERKRIFEPFYTTKQSGSGLGLYLSRKIVAEMQGELDIQSQPQAGTIARLTLPLALSLSSGTTPAGER